MEPETARVEIGPGFLHELEPMALYETATGRFVNVNKAWVEQYRYSPEEARAMRLADIAAGPTRPGLVAESRGTGEQTRVALAWHRSRDGKVFPVEVRAGELIVGRVEMTLAVMRDITERHRAHNALARSEVSYRQLIESMPDGVIVHRNGVVVYMSPSARKMLGYSLQFDVTRLPVAVLVHPADRRRILENIYERAINGHAAAAVEQRLVRRDGTTVVAEVAALSTVFDGERAILAIARDVTARKDIEAQLVMNDRLASLGRLAASVGHELNNPLAYILGNVEMIKRDLGKRRDLPRDFVDRFGTYVGMVAEGAVRMRDIVHDLKTLARGDDEDRGPVDVQSILDVCANMAEHELRPRTKLVKDYRDRVFVLGTSARLGQVFLNLIVNAAQAIPEGHADDNEVRVLVRSLDERRVEVAISDTGEGVPPSNLDRIFEPFFTTKHGAGTGLGLSISHRIITSAGGTITAEHRPERGTVFRVVLPAAESW